MNRKTLFRALLLLGLAAGTQPTKAQFNIKKAVDGVAKVTKAATLTDEQRGSLSEALINTKYSQKQGSAADDYGYEFLKKAGKNPLSTALSFRKLKELQEKNGTQASGKLNQLFSSHPDLDRRIARMEERARADGIALPAGD